MILYDDYFHSFFFHRPFFSTSLCRTFSEHSLIFGDFMTFSRRSIPFLVGRAVDGMGFAGQQLIELRNQITLSLAHRYRHPRIIGVWHRKRAGNSFETKAAAVENYFFWRPARIAGKGICSNAISRCVHEGRARTDNAIDRSSNSSLV